MGNFLGKIFEDPDLRCAAGIASSPLLGPVVGVAACEESITSRMKPRVCETTLPPEVCEKGRALVEGLHKTYRTFVRPPLQIPGLRCKIDRELLNLGLSVLGVGGLPVAVGLERFGYPKSCSKDRAQSLRKIGELAAKTALFSAGLGAGAILNKAVGLAAQGVIPTESYREKILEAAEAGAFFFLNPLF